MKTKLSYDELFKLSIELADRIKEYMPEVQEVIAVSRGGLTVAHIIAKHLRLPVGLYIPKTHTLVSEFKNIVIVEDLVAEGRTFDSLQWTMNTHYPSKNWLFAPFLIDLKYKGPAQLCPHALSTAAWVVFPWEDFDKMQEGDRGLFRNGSDAYGK